MRLFAKYEQIAELFEVTPKKIMVIIVWCIENSVSEFSEKNIMHKFNPFTVERASLAMNIVEIAYVAEGVRKLSEACYTLEGDSCLILCALSVLIRMEIYIDNGYHTPRLEDAVDIALPFLQSV